MPLSLVALEVELEPDPVPVDVPLPMLVLAPLLVPELEPLAEPDPDALPEADRELLLAAASWRAASWGCASCSTVASDPPTISGSPMLNSASQPALATSKARGMAKWRGATTTPPRMRTRLPCQP